MNIEVISRGRKLPLSLFISLAADISGQEGALAWPCRVLTLECQVTLCRVEQFVAADNTLFSGDVLHQVKLFNIVQYFPQIFILSSHCDISQIDPNEVLQEVFICIT